MRIILVALLLIWTSMATAQEGVDSDFPTVEEFQAMNDEFGLSTNCQPIGLFVLIDNNQKELELDEETIQNAVESRLRSARLYDDSWSSSQLEVYVHVVGLAFNITLSLEKFVTDSITGHPGIAKTWQTIATGTHGNDENYIVSAISQYIDSFLVEFLRVNEGAC